MPAGGKPTKATRPVSKKKAGKTTSLDQSDEIYILKNFQDNLLNNIILSGVKNISKVVMRKITDRVILEDGRYNKRECWVLDTVGTNLLEILSLDFIDATKTISNDIQEVYKTLFIALVLVTIIIYLFLKM